LFDATRWNEQVFTWENKKFIRATIPQILHYPLPGIIRRIMRKMWKQATEAGAQPEREDFLMLAYDRSHWKCELYMPVKDTVPGADNVLLSGRYFTKVFDGPFSLVPKFTNDMDILLANREMLAKRYFFYSASCPLCARKVATDKIVAFAEI